MNFLGSNFFHLGQWALTPKSAVGAGVGETSDFCTSWVSTQCHLHFLCTGCWSDYKRTIRACSSFVVWKKIWGETFSAMDGQSSTETMSHLASLVSNSASSSSVVSTHISNCRGSLGLYGLFYHSSSMLEWSELSSDLHQCPWVLDDPGLAWHW